MPRGLNAGVKLQLCVMKVSDLVIEMRVTGSER